ncbi:uncharacterized protein F4822DRAFT_444085 [Hypoxylon trugodes]|uniref:uncharacterized protein n=1 Tax=Hypoxylon trugodes TaxID=326681 RepID=UPI00219B475F|nr:uncharacterized protein F4822DRAFT_444085 [Hypoxylon trugodes]KAI1387328.1 hypothetical protein F4822DRAFT_444085 [Hypoxylon trugodes]
MNNKGAPTMPRAASSNMAMNMSTTAIKSQKVDEAAETQSSKENESSGYKSPPNGKPSTASQAAMNMQRDTTRRKEISFNMERIQMAEKLGNERNLCIALDKRVTDLVNELASLKSKNKVLEAECEALRSQLNDVTKQLEARTSHAREAVLTMQKKIVRLEITLALTEQSLEQSKLSQDELKEAHREAIESSTSQADQRDRELEAMRDKLHDLQVTYEEAQEKHKLESEASEIALEEIRIELDDAKVANSNLQNSHELRERNLQQRLTSRGNEAKDLKREVSSLTAARAEAVSKKQAAEYQLRERAEDQVRREEELQENHKETQADLAKVREDLRKLQKSTESFPQMVVICVDVSGSLSSNIHEVKQIYRDVLHKVVSNNKEAEVAVVIHGARSQNDGLPARKISDETFRFLDFVIIGGNEDYTYCIKKANELFEPVPDSQKLVILIGDGDAMYSNRTTLVKECERLKSSRILAHSMIMLSNHRLRYSTDFDMVKISNLIGGRTEWKDTYLSALDEILLHEREQYFKAS